MIFFFFFIKGKTGKWLSPISTREIKQPIKSAYFVYVTKPTDVFQIDIHLHHNNLHILVLLLLYFDNVFFFFV